MDLSSLYTNLPPGQLAQAERQMMENFRAAALSITTLYKSSLNTSKQAYTAGYSACLNDILQTLQASLATTADSQHPQNAEEAGRTLGRLMDWIEARQEALKLQDEDDREEQQQAESSMQAADREARRREAVANASASTASRLGSHPMEETTNQEEMAVDADQDHNRTSQMGRRRAANPPGVNPRQRDALVQAMNRHQQRSRSVEQQTPTTAISRKDDVDVDTPVQPVFASYQPSRPNPIDSSSPIQAFSTPPPSFHHTSRPAKPLPNHLKGKSTAMITAADPFNPDLPVDLPFLSLFNPSASGMPEDGDISNDFRIGSKRPLEAVTFSGFRDRDGAVSAPPTGKGGRRRMGGAATGFDGSAMSDTEERDRKRMARRG